MRARSVLQISLLLNVGLAITAVFYLRQARRGPSEVVDTNAQAIPNNPTGQIRTRVFLRQENFNWEQVESADYAEYIANLRKIGCPKKTIRDIIVADVNELFARKRLEDIQEHDMQWWRSDPDPKQLQAAAERAKALEAERRTLLTKLLGPDWQESDLSQLAPPKGVPLSGPVLSRLAPDVQKKVQDIIAASQQRTSDYLDAQAKEGQQPDPAAVARLRETTRRELTSVLGPTELEEFLLRHSNNADRLRNELRGFEATPEEFRKLFGITDSIDRQLQLLEGNNDPEAVKKRDALGKQRDEEIKGALPSERYQIYALNKDPLYRDAQSVVKLVGVPEDAILPLYQINQASALEQDRIRSDTSLTPEEQLEAIQIVQQEQLLTLHELLGDEAYKRYLQRRLR
jgi:hypothetical protein